MRLRYIFTRPDLSYIIVLGSKGVLALASYNEE